MHSGRIPVAERRTPQRAATPTIDLRVKQYLSTIPHIIAEILFMPLCGRSWLVNMAFIELHWRAKEETRTFGLEMLIPCLFVFFFSWTGKKLSW